MKLTNENYFSTEADKHYMSVSQFKAFEECPACAMAVLNGEYTREKTMSMNVGSYVDAYFSNELDAFMLENPEIFKRDGTLKSEFIQAQKIISRIQRDETLMEYLGGKSQVIMTGEIAGVPIKIKIDSLHPDKIVDLKIMANFEPKYKPEQGRLAWFEYWRYDLQGAVYREIVRQNTGMVLPFYLAAATKEKTTDIDLVHISDTALDFELERFMEKAPFYDAIKKGVITTERCGKCDYCKETKIITVPTESEEYENE